MTESLSCHVCRRSQIDVRTLIAVPNQVTVCSECVGVMMQIIAQSDPDEFERYVQTAREFRPDDAQH